jgi:hypothetical protein
MTRFGSAAVAAPLAYVEVTATTLALLRRDNANVALNH